MFFDPQIMHPIHYKGRYFSVDGHLNIYSLEQGGPVIFQAGTSETFMNIATKHAEAFGQELKRRVLLKGRTLS